MTTFDSREKGFEDKFAHDSELQFKVTARRNKLLGLWAADKLGKKGESADAYAKEVILADFEEAGDEDVFRKVFNDFRDGGLDIGETEIRHQMHALFDEAKKQLMSE